MTRKNSNAFSLIEALIILLLISVTIAAATPLITKKISLPKWSMIKNSNNQSVAITYGANNYDRVGIGSGVNPYQTNPDTQGKMVTNDMIIQNSTPSDYTSVFLGSLYTSGGVYNEGVGNNIFPNSNSLVVGNNASRCLQTLEHSVVLRNPAGSTNCPNPATDFDGRLNISTYAHGVAYDAAGAQQSMTSYIQTTPAGAGTGQVDISTNGGRTRILLNNNNVTFTVNNDSNILKFDAATSTLSTNKKLVLQAEGGTNDLYLGEGSSAKCDGVDCDPSGVKISTKSIVTQNDTDDNCPDGGSCGVCRNFDNPSTPKAFVKGKIVSGLTPTYCNSTEGLLWTSSDRRLKDIKADYTKGIKELSKLNTYYYTFKKDKKQTMYIGIIAQHLKGIFDIALRKNSDGYYSYEKSAIFYAMINSVKSINKKQNDIAKAQKDMNAEADRLIRMYK